MNGSIKAYLEEIKRQHEAGSLSQEQATEFIVVALIEQAINNEEVVNRLSEIELAQNKRVDELEKKIEERFDELSKKIDDAAKMQSEHPSLLYLLRYDTKRTVATILFIFLVLSTWFVSGVRQPILEWFGLPVF